MDVVHERYLEFCRLFEDDPEVNPGEFTVGLDRDQVAELTALIDSWLAAQPSRGWDRAAYTDSPVSAMVDRLIAGDEPETWRDLLPRLRSAARLHRDRLADRLAGALGAPGEVERVRFYYHHMENGTLPAAGVSDRVLTELGRILSVDPERLRRAGALQQSGEPQGPAPVFARTVTGSDAGIGQLRADVVEPQLSGSAEVDRLFRGDPE